ncbi:MAG: DnaB-like helicase N-terminal domain-containing protein, partial [Planctomycetota bacterium]
MAETQTDTQPPASTNGTNGHVPVRREVPPPAEQGSSEAVRLPPNDIVAEMCLLASLMLDRDMVGDIAPVLEKAAFYLPEH